MRPGFFVNPDDVFVKNFKKRLKQNNGFCPCKLQRIPDNKCPCKDFRETGECTCGLYIKDPTYIIATEGQVDRESQLEGYV